MVMDTSGSDRTAATSPAVSPADIASLSAPTPGAPAGQAAPGAPTADAEPAVVPGDAVPGGEAPTAETAPAEAPAAELPAAEPSVAEIPAAEAPAAGVAAPEVPAAELPAAEAPAGEPPATGLPAAEPAETPAEAPAEPVWAESAPEGAKAGSGWIDAEGTVFVRTAAGDRSIGSWQAGSVEEGISHFKRRYDDLVTEVELLEARLAGGMSDAAHTRTSAARLKDSLAEVHAIGDLDALAKRLDTLIERSAQKADEQKAAKAQAREEATARKQALVAEAEQIAADSTQWKASGDRLRDILAEWKTIRGVDRKTDTELWRRYAAARDGFSRRRGSHFAGLDAQRKQVQQIKEQLVAEAEELAESTDWQATANRLKQLMADWKAAGRAPRDAEEQLWKRFRAAQDTFFAHRSATFSERDAELRGNQTKKEELLAEAERIDPDQDLRAAQTAMRDVQARWDEIGRVPRESVASLDRRLRAIEERVRHAADAEWRRGSVESNPLLGQMREQVAKAERQLERARAAGDQRRIADAEKALESKRQFLALAEQAG
jgi:hypothetical protein